MLHATRVAAVVVLAAGLAACSKKSSPPAAGTGSGSGTGTAATAPPPTAPPATTPAPGSPASTGPLDEEAFKALHTLREDQAPPRKGTRIQLAGGSHYLSLPPTGKPPFPAVVVIHEWWGKNAHIEHWADRLAAAGYAALAVDLYRGVVATTPDQAMTTMKAVDSAQAAATVGAALDFLTDDQRVEAQRTGVIGWCFGGAWSLQTALTHPDLDAAVIYYGQLEKDPAQLAKIEAKVLGVFGTRDQGIPIAEVDAFEAALSEANVDARILRYDADHAFANPSGGRYDQVAAAAAWAEVETFLAANLQP